jgi:hypothetical protein
VVSYRIYEVATMTKIEPFWLVYSFAHGIDQGPGTIGGRFLLKRQAETRASALAMDDPGVAFIVLGAEEVCVLAGVHTYSIERTTAQMISELSERVSENAARMVPRRPPPASDD